MLPSTPAQRGHSLWEGWQDPSEEQKRRKPGIQLPVVLSKRSRAQGSSCEVGDASQHWQGQGWHKSPPTTVTAAYFSKHITKEAKYTFSIQITQSSDSPEPKNKSLWIVPGPELDCLQTKPCSASSQSEPLLCPWAPSGTGQGGSVCPHLPQFQPRGSVVAHPKEWW